MTVIETHTHTCKTLLKATLYIKQLNLTVQYDSILNFQEFASICLSNMIQFNTDTLSCLHTSLKKLTFTKKTEKNVDIYAQGNINATLLEQENLFVMTLLQFCTSNRRIPLMSRFYAPVKITISTQHCDVNAALRAR